MNTWKTSLCAVAASMAIGPLAYGQGVRTERTISLALASEAALAAVADCTAKGYFVTAAVVDRAGHIKAMARGDNAGPHSVDSSRREAYTTASLRVPTTALIDACSQVGIDKIKDRLN